MSTNTRQIGLPVSAFVETRVDLSRLTGAQYESILNGNDSHAALPVTNTRVIKIDESSIPDSAFENILNT